MKTTTAMFFGLLTASSVIAAPGTAKRAARHAEKRAARAAGAHKSGLFIKSNVTESTNGPDDYTTEYSTNWAGAALTSTGITYVTGTFTVPSVSDGSSSSGESSGSGYSASAWVGIDGFTCETAILQTGVDFTIDNGETSYDAWYEWYPDYAYDFDDITIAEGDVIKVTVEATSKKAGTATIENTSTGTTVTHSFSSESDELCEYNAEWIVEDYEEDDELVALADFGTITFTDAYAKKTDTVVYVTDSTLIDMETDEGSLEAEASVSGDEEVIVKYV